MDGSPHTFGVFEDAPTLEDFYSAVTAGLAQKPKSIPCKFLYDHRGTQWFEAITRQPEYYPTAREAEILREQADRIADCLGSEVLLMEYGSGDGHKIGWILEALDKPAGYLVVDISESGLKQTIQRVHQSHPTLSVQGVLADYTQPWELPPLPDHRRRVIVFLGSTIGNFHPDEAVAFLKKCHAVLRSGDGMLVGVDLKKDINRLNAAYNDAQGATQAFNLNLLRRINEELGGNFELDRFEHRAFYNPAKGRMEMHLQSVGDQTVRIGERIFDFADGETVHTENSYKYTIKQFLELAGAAGLESTGMWTDSDGWFSLHYLSVR